jgi:hypothetical protein
MFDLPPREMGRNVGLRWDVSQLPVGGWDRCHATVRCRVDGVSLRTDWPFSGHPGWKRSSLFF